MKMTKAQLEAELRSLRVKLAHAERLAIERLNDLNRLQTARREDMQMHDNLQSKLNACEAERDQARSAADEARNVALDDIAKAWKEVQGARRERDAAISAKAQAEVERYAATQERDAARKERDAKTRECIDIVGSVRDLERESDDARKGRDAAESLAADLANRVENLQYGIADRNAKITRLHEERDEVRGQAEKAGTELQQIRETCGVLNNDLSYWKGQHNEVFGKLSAANKRIDELTEQRDTAEREREEYAGQLTEAEKKRDEYAEKLVKTCAAVSFLEGQLAAVESNLKSSSDQFVASEVRARYAESRADYWEARVRGNGGLK